MEVMEVTTLLMMLVLLIREGAGKYNDHKVVKTFGCGYFVIDYLSYLKKSLTM